MDVRIGRRSFASIAAVAAASAAGIGGAFAKGKPASPGQGAPGKNKVAICHLDDDTGLYSYKQVPPTAVKGHLKHGDVVEGVTGPDFCEALNQPPT